MKIKFLRLILSGILFWGLIPYSSGQNNINQTNGNSNKHGLWEKKDTLGNLLYTGTFNNNVPEGKFTYFDTTGKVRAITQFSDKGTKAYTKLFNSGKLQSEGLYVNEKKHGEWKFYNTDSIVIAEEVYVNGTPSGTWKTYYANGALLEEVAYENGEKHGSWKQYFYDGLLKTQGTYKNGKLEGLASFYHPNGRVFISGPYVNNLKDGIWMHLNDTGVAEKREIWSKGYLVSEEFFNKDLERMLKEEK